MLFDGWGDIQWWVVAAIVAVIFLLLGRYSDEPRN